jgi:hypothetical protein
MTVTIGRRELLAAVGGAAAWPLAARAQQARVPVVGFLNPGSAELNTSLLAAFRKGLAGPLHRGQECRDRIPTCRRRDHTTGDAATA